MLVKQRCGKRCPLPHLQYASFPDKVFYEGAFKKLRSLKGRLLDEQCKMMDDIQSYTDDELSAKLKSLSLKHGPITKTTRSVFENVLRKYYCSEDEVNFNVPFIAHIIAHIQYVSSTA